MAGQRQAVRAVAKLSQERRLREGADEILSGMEEYGHLFAGPEDTDEYEWFRRLAKYSPIVHMQQTDGVTAGHVSFTPKANKRASLLENACSQQSRNPMPARMKSCPGRKIYLSFELFIPIWRPNTAFSSSFARRLRTGAGSSRGMGSHLPKRSKIERHNRKGSPSGKFIGTFSKSKSRVKENFRNE